MKPQEIGAITVRSAKKRERNSTIRHLRRAGNDASDIAVQFGISGVRVRQVIASSAYDAALRIKLQRIYGRAPNIATLPDRTSVDVLVLCNVDVHGWTKFVARLRQPSIGVRTLGDLRHKTDEELLAQPRIGKQMLMQLRLVCPFRAP